MFDVHNHRGIWSLLKTPLYYPDKHKEEEFLQKVLEHPDCTTEILIHFLETAPLAGDYPSTSTKQSWPHLREETALAILECIYRKSGNLEVTIKAALHKNVRELLNINWLDLPEYLDGAFKQLPAKARFTLAKKVLRWRRAEINYWAIKERYNDCVFGMLYDNLGGKDNRALARILQMSLRNEEINEGGASESTDLYEHQERMIDIMLKLCK